MNLENIVGIIPAAGVASRISPIPCSKEIFPIDFDTQIKKNKKIPKVVSSYLVQNMKEAGADNLFFILRPNKWDILSYYMDGSSYDVNIAYLLVNKSYGVPFTVNQAFPFVNNEIVLFGFPDVIIKPTNAFSQIKDEFANTNSHVVLGLFPVENPVKWDMVKSKESGEILSIEIKPEKTNLKYAWSIACWDKVFTQFINKYCINIENSMHPDTYKELHMGNCLMTAIEHGLIVRGFKFESGESIDIGTPEDLIHIMKYNLSKV